MSIIEKFKEKHKFNNIKSLLQKYNNNLYNLLFNEKLLEFEIEYLIQNFELDKDNWNKISIYQKLSEEFIENYKELVDWELISGRQKLSEEFIEKHLDLVDWYQISQHQQLSEEFIEKYIDLVNWYEISQYQILSEMFIEKHLDKIYLDGLVLSDKIDNEVVAKFVSFDKLMELVRKYGK